MTVINNLDRYINLADCVLCFKQISSYVSNIDDFMIRLLMPFGDNVDRPTDNCAPIKPWDRGKSSGHSGVHPISHKQIKVNTTTAHQINY